MKKLFLAGLRGALAVYVLVSCLNSWANECEETLKPLIGGGEARSVWSAWWPWRIFQGERARWRKVWRRFQSEDDFYLLFLAEEFKKPPLTAEEEWRRMSQVFTAEKNYYQTRGLRHEFFEKVAPEDFPKTIKFDVEVLSRHSVYRIYYDYVGRDYDHAPNYFVVVGDVILPVLGVSNPSRSSVYRFKRRQRLDIQNMAIFFLKQIPESSLVLFRGLSPEEQRLWKKGDVEGLRQQGQELLEENGGRKWGFDEPVMFFSYNGPFRQGTSHSVSVRLSRETLVRWVATGQAEVRLNPFFGLFEVVLRTEVWPELVENQL